jgi:hypothetical protein
MACSVQGRPKDRQVKSKVKSMFITFLRYQGDCLAYYRDFYGDCVKMCKNFPRILVTKELAVASQQHTASHFAFHKRIFDQNNITTKTIEAESQATLNTFQNAFKKWQKCREWCIHAEEATSRMMMSSRPEVSF